MAQENPKIEVFGGYQFMHAGNFAGFNQSANTNGWDTSATVSFAKHLGVTSDFSGNYKTETVTTPGLGALTGTAAVRVYTYTFGPTASFQSGDFKIFAHALFGRAHVRPTGCVVFSGSPDECGSGAVTGFAMIVGGGVDVRAGKRAALRLIQFDWMRLPYEFGAQNNNYRLGVGVVFRF
jgi:hypothetical protein